MSNSLLYGWIICYLISYILNVSLSFTKKNNNLDKLDIFLSFISWISGIAAFIMFIVWLTRFTNKQILKKLWIAAIIILIVSIALILILSGKNNSNIITIPGYLAYYSFTIFLGSFITFLVRK